MKGKRMKKCLSILVLMIICMQMISCGQQEKTNTENIGQAQIDAPDIPDENGEPAAEPETKMDAETAAETVSLDSLAGYYIRGVSLPDDRSISLDFFIYEEEGCYYGYMNMIRYEQIEGQEYREDFQVRLLMEIRREQDEIQAVCVEDFSEPDHQDRFGAYQEGDLLFTLHMDAEGLCVSWEKFGIDGLEDTHFFPDEDCLSVELISQRDIEIFLRARGMEGKLLLRYDEDASGMEDYLEVYYDEEKETGAGVYCNVVHIEDYGTFQYYGGFDIAGCKHQQWEDHRFDVIHDGEDLLTVYDFEKEYNENGQIKKLETRGVIEGWRDSPYEDTIVCVEYFYREDGTLERKDCYYNEREFGTTGQSQKYYYDERERLKYAYFYITHGALQEYYFYEGECMEPSYCIRLDFGAFPSTDYFIKYDGE
ncbi:MAG: hypothetical protein K2K74_05390 [Lachnospiraceae bacterium]|nr:hypothetical protein [Lachnospiraceae bacterium]